MGWRKFAVLGGIEAGSNNLLRCAIGMRYGWNCDCGIDRKEGRGVIRRDAIHLFFSPVHTAFKPCNWIGRLWFILVRGGRKRQRIIGLHNMQRW